MRPTTPSPNANGRSLRKAALLVATLTLAGCCLFATQAQAQAQAPAAPAATNPATPNTAAGPAAAAAAANPALPPRVGAAAPRRPSAAASAAAPAAAASAAAAGDGSDRAQLDRTQIVGNRELPKVLYIVPWKRPIVGTMERPVRSVLDEVFAPIDREVLRRQVRYEGQIRTAGEAALEAANNAATIPPK